MVKKGIKISYEQLGKLINKNKVRILKILEEENKLNLSQLERKLKISSKETRRHTKGLVDAGLVRRIRKTKIKSAPVLLSLRKKHKKK